MSDDFDSPIGPDSENYQDTDERNNSDYRRENYLLSYNRQVTEKLNLGVFISHLQGEYGQPPSAFLPGPRKNRLDPYANNPNYQRTEDQRGTTLQIGGDYAFSDNWGAKLWFFNNELEENELRYDNANYNSFIQRGSRDLDNETNIHGFHAQIDGFIASTNTEIGFSVDRRNEAFESEGIRCDASGGGGGGGSSTCHAASDFTRVDIDEDIDIESYGVEIVQRLPYELTAVAGVAYHKLDKANDSDESEQSARFVLSKAFGQDTSVYGSLSRKVDSPTIRQLYDEEGGNETLGFQKANHLELGLNQHWNSVDLNIALYKTKVFDFIERNTDRVFESRQELTLEGVDVTAAIQATNRLTIRAGIGLLNAKDESSDALSSTLQYRPKNKLTLDADYLINNNWSVAANLIHIGSQAYFNRDDESEHREFGSYQLVGTKLSYRLPDDSGQVYVGVDNLFDEDYQTSYGFPQAGRFLYTGINLNWH